MTKPKHRKTVCDTDIQPLGMFAVMRHSRILKSARFCALHDSYDSATAEAVRLVTNAASDTEIQHTYYVLEVAAMFSIGPQGLRSQERKA